FIQGGRTFTPDSASVRELDEQLTLAKSLLSQQQKTQKGKHLPIGVGFVLFSDCAATHFGATTAPVLARHRPAAVWLFAPHPDNPDTLRHVVGAVREAAAATTKEGDSWNPRVVVQVGTVAAARQAAELGADVIVAQGVDAGGHQFTTAAGIVSLVPEVRDMVRDEFPDRDIAVWAAGGIADGRGVAAALALGAEAAVMGTRYVVAHESDAQDYKRQALLSASDGATNTAKSYVHDRVQGNWTWPSLYDARALVHPSYTDDLAGMAIKENEARYKAAKEKGDDSMMVTWSGSGVGLIRDAAPAAEITKKVREEATKVIQGLKALL
ncbi:hypothetical protein CIB48_g5741, partial [Xylaria polymorpha]